MKTQTVLKARIAVRVIAKGGKFLGDDISGAMVTIHNAHTQELLASGRTQGGSGDIWEVMIKPRPRTMPIPNKGASVFQTEISSETNEPVLLLITAKGPGAGLQSTATASTTQWIVPGLTNKGKKTTIDYSCELELPGLIVQVMEPATHLNITQKLPQSINFSVNVAMMCGCPIDDNKDTDGTHTFPNPWRVDDFMVGCYISCEGKPTEHVSLTFDKANSPGRYVGKWQMKTAGFYTCHVYAYQLSTKNTGCATLSFFSIPKK